MIKKLFVGLFVCSLLITGCKEEEEDLGTKPIAGLLSTASSLSNLSNGIEKTTFSIGDVIWVGLDVYDPDKDVKKWTVIQSRASEKPISVDIDIDSMPYDECLFYSPFQATADDVGTWGISSYVVDSKGNKSNTSINTFRVTY